MTDKFPFGAVEITHLDGACPLPWLGVIRVAGADARTFLQGQLTQDFASIRPGEARLAAFLSPKGRMQASFVGWSPADDEVLLVCSRDLLEATRKRMSMFVMRAKAVLTDASDAYQLTGLLGNAIVKIAGGALPASATAVFDAGTVIGLPPVPGLARALCIRPAAPEPSGQLDVPALAESDWRIAEVMSGVATLSAPVVDKFVPQMLNFESVGGVSFKKGCYPGQEVVARSQFRGTLKRRAFIVQADAPLEVGAEVFHASDHSQPCGSIVQVAPIAHRGSVAIASLQVAATEAGLLRAGDPGGTVLEVLPLPYPLLDDL